MEKELLKIIKVDDDEFITETDIDGSVDFFLLLAGMGSVICEIAEQTKVPYIDILGYMNKTIKEKIQGIESIISDKEECN